MKEPIKYDIYDTMLGHEWDQVTDLKVWCIDKWCNYRGVMTAENKSLEDMVVLGGVYKKGGKGILINCIVKT